MDVRNEAREAVDASDLLEGWSRLCALDKIIITLQVWRMRHKTLHAVLAAGTFIAIVILVPQFVRAVKTDPNLGFFLGLTLGIMITALAITFSRLLRK